MKKENYYIGKNYARLEIDWDRKQAEMVVKNELGETVLQTEPRQFQQDALSQAEIDQVAHCIDGHMTRPFLQIAAAFAAVAVVIVRQCRKT